MEVLLAEKFLPTLTGLAVTHSDHVLYGLPVRDSGLGVEICDLCYNVSRSCTDVTLKGLQPYSVEDHITAVNEGQTDLRRRKELIFGDAFNYVIRTFGLQQQRAIK